MLVDDELDVVEPLNGEVLDSVIAERIPAVVFTADFNRDLRERLLQKGVADYHVKNNENAIDLVLSSVVRLLGNRDVGVLVVDDLTDTGKTALEVRQMMPKAHFACVYAKPKGVPTIDTFVTEVSQDTWIYFPWDMGFTYQEPIAKGSKG